MTDYILYQKSIKCDNLKHDLFERSLVLNKSLQIKSLILTLLAAVISIVLGELYFCFLEGQKVRTDRMFVWNMIPTFPIMFSVWFSFRSKYKDTEEEILGLEKIEKNYLFTLIVFSLFLVLLVLPKNTRFWTKEIGKLENSRLFTH